MISPVSSARQALGRTGPREKRCGLGFPPGQESLDTDRGGLMSCDFPLVKLEVGAGNRFQPQMDQPLDVEA